MNPAPRDIELAEFPRSDAPARLMVVIAATLAIAPIAICAVIAASGHQFYPREYDIAYGVIAVVGISLQLLLTLVFLVARAPTRAFACKSLLATFVLIFAFFALALPYSI